MRVCLVHHFVALVCINLANTQACISKIFKLHVLDTPGQFSLTDLNSRTCDISRLRATSGRCRRSSSSVRPICEQFEQVKQQLDRGVFETGAKKYLRACENLVEVSCTPSNGSFLVEQDVTAAFTVKTRDISKKSLQKDITSKLTDLDDHLEFLLERPILVADIVKSRFVSLTVPLKKYALTSGVQPSNSAIHEYRQLALNGNASLGSCYDFFSTYGSLIGENVTYGGAIRFLLSCKNGCINFTEPSSLLSLRLAELSGAEGMLSFQVSGGSQNSTLTIGDWIDSLNEHPVPISKDYVHVTSLLEEVSSIESPFHFQRLMEFEKNVSMLALTSLALRTANASNSLARFVTLMIDREAKEVCPLEYFTRMLEKYVIESKNFDLKMYHINCTIDTDIYQLLLLPNVCARTGNKMRSCAEIQYKFPPNISCVRIFRRDDCFSDIGDGVVLANSSSELILKLRNANSLTLCDID